MERKFILVTFLLLGCLVMGCSNTESATSSGEQINEAESGKAQLDTKNINGFALKEGDYVHIHGAAALKNTGDTPIRIKEVQFNFEAKDGSVIGTETPLSAMPVIIKPGETSMAGATYMDEDANLVEQFDKVTINVDYEKTTEKPSKWKIDNLKGRKTEFEYKYTGRVTNKMDEKTGQIWITIGMFDKEGNILATMDANSDATLNPGGSTGFESFSDFDMPDSILKKVDHTEVGVISVEK